MTKTIAHFRTGIGNFIMMTPALRALASMDPSGKVDICTDVDWTDSRKDGMLDIWRNLPFVEDVFVFDFSRPEAVKMPKDYSVWYYAEWATHGGAMDFFSRRKPYHQKRWDHNVTHESDYYFDIVKEHYGYTGEKPAQFIQAAENPAIDLGKRKLVCLCNGSFGDQAVAKKWDYFPVLAAELKNYYGDKISIAKIGNSKELSDVGVFDYDFVGKLSFTETAKVIDQCSLMVTTDTGLMHACDALKRPMVVLWGGAALVKNRPIAGSARVIHLGLGCQPCFRNEGYRDCMKYSCMADITVNEVMYNVRSELNVGD
jgi:ADP-heptose:LPS heptosyltransferase